MAARCPSATDVQNALHNSKMCAQGFSIKNVAGHKVMEMDVNPSSSTCPGTNGPNVCNVTIYDNGYSQGACNYLMMSQHCTLQGDGQQLLLDPK